MRLNLLPILLAGQIASAAMAAEFPRTALLGIGFVEARLPDFEGTAGYATRQAAPDGLLSLTADLNGDGRDDEVRILLNRERQIAYVAATMMTHQLDTYVLEQMPLDRAADTGLRLAPAGPNGRTGVAIFPLSGGAGESLYFEGEEFRSATRN